MRSVTKVAKIFNVNTSGLTDRERVFVRLASCKIGVGKGCKIVSFFRLGASCFSISNVSARNRFRFNVAYIGFASMSRRTRSAVPRVTYFAERVTEIRTLAFRIFRCLASCKRLDSKGGKIVPFFGLGAGCVSVGNVNADYRFRFKVIRVV